MLVLSRKKSELIRIGDDITVMIIRCGTTVVSVGIDAPRGVKILRGELATEGADSGHRNEHDAQNGSDAT